MRKIFNYSNIILWLMIIVIIYVFAILATESSKNYQLRSKSDDLESQIARLQGQIEDLGYKVTYYKTDTYRETLAREKLNVAAPGESVIIIRDDKSKKNDQAQEVAKLNLKSDQEILSEKSNFEQWRLFLFGR